MARRVPALVRTASPEVLWPALPSPPATQLLAQLYQLEQSQWWSEALLRACQIRQLLPLARHAVAHSPFYRERFAAAGVSLDQALTWDSFASLPVLTRRDLLTRADAIHAAEVPAHHGEPRLVQTSGSTGQVVAVRRTHLAQLTLYALGMRAHAWFNRDFALPLAVVRADSPLMDDDVRARELGWGHPASLVYPTGPGFSLPIATPVSEQALWLQRRNPGYLLTYPTNLAALLEDFAVRGRRLSALREVRTVGETVTPALRARCREVLGVPIVDGYSSQEVGVIALECPESGLYHVQSESLIVEVLDAAGAACAPGSVGRVVVTDLHNFATPLLRYELGDRAEVGPACSCGRGLPTLTRVLGRERNLLTLPNGDRHWPLVGLHRYSELGVLQYQLVQHSLERIEVRLVVSHVWRNVPEAVREQRLTEIVQGALGHPFNLEFRYYEAEIPRGPGGKYEEFISRV